MGVDCDFPLPCKCGCCSSDEEMYTSMQEEIEDAWEAARTVAQEPGWLHETLTQNGVPEQIPPFKTGRAPAKARVLFLACDRDALREALREIASEGCRIWAQPYPNCGCASCIARRALAASEVPK